MWPQEKAESAGPPWQAHEEHLSSLLVVNFYRLILYLNCAIVMDSFATDYDSMSLMSSSGIHGSVPTCSAVASKVCWY